MTLIAGLRLRGLTAARTFDGPINAALFEDWVETCLVPTLSPGEIVVMDNLPAHKGPRVEQLIKAAGAQLRYLPAYSPDMNPIEKAFSSSRPSCAKSPNYRQLGKALTDAEQEAETAQGIAGVWLLALTGCRSGEITNLKWAEIDEVGSCFRLQDSKEGASVRPIGRAVLDCLSTIEKKLSCPYVLAPMRSGEAFGGMPRAWSQLSRPNYKVLRRTR